MGMVEDNPLNWEKEPRENFLPEHVLFWAVHKDKWIHWPNLDEIEPNAFNLPRIGENGMSVDWGKHCSSPEISLFHKKKPTREINGIMQIFVKGIEDSRELVFPNLDLEHIPIRLPPPGRLVNRAHSEILNFPPRNQQKITCSREMVHIRAILVTCPSCRWALKPIK